MQEDFKTISYKVIGDDLAPDLFEINGDTGEIRVKTSLDIDTEELYRVRFSHSLSLVHADLNF